MVRAIPVIVQCKYSEGVHHAKCDLTKPKWWDQCSANTAKNQLKPLQLCSHQTNLIWGQYSVNTTKNQLKSLKLCSQTDLMWGQYSVNTAKN